MRRVVGDIVIPIFLALKFYDETVRDAVLHSSRRQECFSKMIVQRSFMQIRKRCSCKIKLKILFFGLDFAYLDALGAIVLSAD